MFSTRFTQSIKVKRGKLLSWPAPPLEWRGHNDYIRGINYSPDGRHIVSGSDDSTIRIWDAETGAPVGEPLKGHTDSVESVAYSPNGQHIVSGSSDSTIRRWDSSSHLPIQLPSSGDHTRANPNPEGWVTDSYGRLLYWVPSDCRTGLHSPALLTIPPTSHVRSVSLDFEHFVFGNSWPQIFNGM